MLLLLKGKRNLTFGCKNKEGKLFKFDHHFRVFQLCGKASLLGKMISIKQSLMYSTALGKAAVAAASYSNYKDSSY
jgi:hypothetical protein